MLKYGDKFGLTIEHLRENGLYQLLPTSDYDPVDKIWEFLPGNIVRAVEKKLNTGTVLVATALSN